MKKTGIVVKVMPTAADILGRTIVAGICGFIGAKMYCDAQAFKAKKIKHEKDEELKEAYNRGVDALTKYYEELKEIKHGKAAEPSLDDEIDVTDLDDKIDEEIEEAYNRGVDALTKYYEELKEANNG